MAEAASKKISELNDGRWELTEEDITVIVQDGETRKVALRYILALLGFPLTFEDVLDCSESPNYPAATKGQLWLTTAGKIGGASGVVVENGDTIVCKVDTVSGDQATVGANWVVLQTNIDISEYALNAEVFHNNIAAEINALTGKTTPVDADEFVIEDSATSPTAYGKKKLTWANLLLAVRTALGLVYGKFTGATTSEKTYTLPDASATIITNQRNEVTGFTEKTTPVDADIVPIEDSASSPTYQKKKLTWANLKAVIRTALGMSYMKFTGTTTEEKTMTVPDASAVLITNQRNEVTGFTEKTTPADTDIIPIEDSASDPTYQKKKVTWTNIKATLKTYFDTLYNLYVHPNHTGDVSSVADGATTIANKAVTLAKMADMATASVIYRKTAEVGAPEVQPLSTLKTDLGLTGTNSGDETAQRIGTIIAGADPKNAPHDNDMLGLADSEATNTVKKLTWAYVKSVLKTYIDAMTSTFTNKRITKRVTSIESHATPTINTDNCDYVEITALAEDVTSMTSNLSGTPTKGQTLWMNIVPTGSPIEKNITWGAKFEGDLLPESVSERTDIGFIWNDITSKWRCVAVNS